MGNHDLSCLTENIDSTIKQTNKLIAQMSKSKSGQTSRQMNNESM